MKKAFTRFPIAWRILRQHRRSGFFNHVWYLEQNPDVHSRTKRPFVHFAFHGAFEGRPPHAGFDPVSYLAANPDVVRSALPAAVHYALYGHAEKRPLVPPPPPPTPAERRLQREKSELTEENELLVLQLHQVQEELEQYFLENRELNASREQLADLRKQHQNLEARQSALAAEKEQVAGDLGKTMQDCEELRAKLKDLEKSASDAQNRHTLLLNSFKEAEAKLSAMSIEREALAKGHEQTKAELATAVTARDSALKERDQARTEREALAKGHEQTKAELAAAVTARDSALKERDRARTEREALAKGHEQTKAELAAAVTEREKVSKERDALKKTATERAMRIAELEAQVADQAERQKKIDEEMAKAEGQLDMLKELLRPALS